MREVNQLINHFFETVSACDYTSTTIVVNGEIASMDTKMRKMRYNMGTHINCLQNRKVLKLYLRVSEFS